MHLHFYQMVPIGYILLQRVQLKPNRLIRETRGFESCTPARIRGAISSGYSELDL